MTSGDLALRHHGSSGKHGCTPFLRETPDILLTCYICPCRTVNDFFSLLVLFLRQMFVFLYFWGYLGLEGSHISGDIKKRSLPVRQGLIKHVCKIQGLSLKNGVDIWTFVCQNYDFAS